MKKTFFTVFIVMAFAFLTGTIGYAVYGLVQIRNENIKKADMNFNKFISIFYEENEKKKQLPVVNEAKYTVAVVNNAKPFAIKPVGIDSGNFTLNDSGLKFNAPAIFYRAFETGEFIDNNKNTVIIYSLYPAFSGKQIYELFDGIKFPLLIFFMIVILMIPLVYLVPQKTSRKINQSNFDIEDDKENPYLKNGSDTFFEEEVKLKSSSANTPEASTRSGLNSYRFLENKLHAELKRAASFDQDIVLALVACSELKTDSDYTEMARVLKNNFIFHDLLFEYENSGFAVILPNMDLDHGIRKLEAIQDQFVNRHNTVKLCAKIGLSSRNGRLLSGKRLIQESQAALKKAASGGETGIVGFRSDPQKYREFLAKKSK